MRAYFFSDQNSLTSSEHYPQDMANVLANPAEARYFFEFNCKYLFNIF